MLRSNMEVIDLTSQSSDGEDANASLAREGEANANLGPLLHTYTDLSHGHIVSSTTNGDGIIH